MIALKSKREIKFSNNIIYLLIIIILQAYCIYKVFIPLNLYAQHDKSMLSTNSPFDRHPLRNELRGLMEDEIRRTSKIKQLNRQFSLLYSFGPILQKSAVWRKMLLSYPEDVREDVRSKLIKMRPDINIEGYEFGPWAHAARMLNYHRSEAENMFAWAIIEFFNIRKMQESLGPDAEYPNESNTLLMFYTIAPFVYYKLVKDLDIDREIAFWMTFCIIQKLPEGEDNFSYYGHTVRLEGISDLLVKIDPQKNTFPLYADEKTPFASIPTADNALVELSRSLADELAIYILGDSHYQERAERVYQKLSSINPRESDEESSSFKISNFDIDPVDKSFVLYEKWNTGDSEWDSNLINSLTNAVLKATKDGARLSGLTVEFIPRETSKSFSQLMEFNEWMSLITNIIVNALHAMSNCSNPLLKIETGTERGFDYLRISDTGHGIPEEDIEKIYAMDYSKKPPGVRETGIGMSIVKDIMDSHGGLISIKSEVGKGTTITLLFKARERYEPNVEVLEESV